MSVLSWVGDRFKDAAGLVGQAEEWVEQRIADAGDWIEGMFDGHPDAQAVQIAEIVRLIQNGYGSADLHEGAQVAQDQMTAQVKISDGSHDLVQRLESAWSGQGADAARENIRPLAVSADDASQSLSANGQNIRTQAESFDRIRNSVQAMANPAPEKGWLDNFNPITTDAERAVDQYNQQAEQNRQLYDAYHQGSATVRQSITIDYGHLPDAQDAQVSTFQIDDSQQPKTDGKDARHDVGHIGVPRTHDGSTQVPPASTYTPPAASAAHPPSVPSYPAGSYGDATRTAGYTPPGYGPNSSPNAVPPGSFGPGGSSYDTSGFVPTGFGPVGGGFGGGGPDGTSAGAGGRGYGPGSGSGAGSPIQGGSRTGTGEGAYSARPGAASAAGAAGAAGARGASGMGGMGGHGKGQGGEDEEHQRASYLVESDPESLFGSDEKTAPPVIGL